MSDDLRDRLAALADEWDAKAGEESRAWAVYGPQTISVPFVVDALRALLAATSEPVRTWPCKHWSLGGPTRCDKCTTPSKPEATVVEGCDCHDEAHPWVRLAPSDLATLLAEHRLELNDFVTVIGTCTAEGCTFRSKAFNSSTVEEAHRAHVAEVIEAAGWRQVTHPNGDPLVPEPDNHHNAAVCPYCSPGYLSPEAVRERESAATARAEQAEQQVTAVRKLLRYEYVSQLDLHAALNGGA